MLPKKIKKEKKLKKNKSQDDEHPVIRLKKPEPYDHESVSTAEKKAPPSNFPSKMAPKAPVKIPAKAPTMKASAKTVPTEMVVKRPAVKRPTAVPNSTAVTKSRG